MLLTFRHTFDSGLRLELRVDLSHPYEVRFLTCWEGWDLARMMSSSEERSWVDDVIMPTIGAHGTARQRELLQAGELTFTK